MQNIDLSGDMFVDAPFDINNFNDYITDVQSEEEKFSSSTSGDDDWYSRSSESGSGSRKRKRSSKHVPHALQPKHKVVRRNNRERTRVHTVNSEFQRLRKLLPVTNRGKRVSKENILKYAILYIKELNSMITQHDQTKRSTNSGSTSQSSVTRDKLPSCRFSKRRNASVDEGTSEKADNWQYLSDRLPYNSQCQITEQRNDEHYNVQEPQYKPYNTVTDDMYQQYHQNQQQQYPYNNYTNQCNYQVNVQMTQQWNSFSDNTDCMDKYMSVDSNMDSLLDELCHLQECH